MALSKANKAIFRAKYGDQLYDAMIAAENVIVTDEGVEKSLADVILTLALKNEIPTNLSELTNGPGYQTQSQVEALIGTAIGAVYKPAGSVAFASLPALTAANLGKVYNITDAFTTTSDFIEGAGKKYKAGADVGIIGIEEGGETVYKYNVFANFVDLSGYIEKVAGATAGNFAMLKADGTIEDTGKKPSDFVAAVAGKGLSTNDYDNTEKQKVTDAYGAMHSHSNKALLDTYTQTEANLADAVSKKHSHANSAVLDGITAEKVTAWDSAGHVYASATQPANLQNGDLWLQTFEE